MSEGKTNSYEAMKAELIEADKYGFLEWVESASGFLDFVIIHSSGVQFRTMSYEGSLELAYQHLMEKKRLAELEGFHRSMATLAINLEASGAVGIVFKYPDGELVMTPLSPKVIIDAYFETKRLLEGDKP